jgi:HAE1 family hydrophobic/amphiphilic exporter-1
MMIILLLVGGVTVYGRMERELFPEIEFPNITIITIYPSANPDAVVRDVTDPIEEAIDGMSGLDDIRSVSSENMSMVVATFEFGEDIVEAERTIVSNLNGISFPDGVEDPIVSRIANDVFPVIQLSVLGDRDIPSLQRILDDLVLPSIERVPGVFEVAVIGGADEQVLVTVDSDKLKDLGLPVSQVSRAIRENNISFPAGSIDNGTRAIPVRTTHKLNSLDEIRDLVIGLEFVPGGRRDQRPIRLSDVAEVRLGTEAATRISRTNGKPSLSITVTKEPDANTVDVTAQVLEALDNLEGLPPDVEIITLTNDGPEIQTQLNSLVQEGFLGLVFAVAMVFVFLLNLRPTIMRGVALTLRPTLIIGLSIPLSILSGILLMGLTGLTLNFMTLAGLAIAVGRVVDDSIVVLENMYRHIQAGEDRLEAAVEGTKEVGAAIVSSTLTTVAVFIPLAFIQGLVGSFFSPFAMAVSFALVGSTLVALTAVPVLGVIFLRQGDLSSDSGPNPGTRGLDSWLQSFYIPVLIWSLRHKLVTILIALGTVAASLSLLLIIPVTLFPSGAPQFLTIDLELPKGTSITRTFEEVLLVEQVLEVLKDEGQIKAYQVSLGASSDEFGPAAGGGGLHRAGFIIAMEKDVANNIGDVVRKMMPVSDEATITVKEIENGPPTDALEINITGSNFTAIAGVANQLEAELVGLDGIINLTSDISEARDEVVISVIPQKAAEFGLTTREVALQVARYTVGETVSEVELEGETMDVVVRGDPDDVDDINKLKSLNIEGPFGLAKLGAMSEIALEKGPVSISRFDGERSASITGGIVGEDTRAVGVTLQAKIDALDVPPSVQVKTGGIFQQIAEGFEDVFTAMAVGIVLVYLVMVATLGSLRNPLVVVISLPLAMVGAFIALTLTGRTLSLSALMGFLLLIGVVVTNAIVLIVFVEQLREQGRSVFEALVEGSQVRMRPILMTAFTTTFALLPLASFASGEGVIIGAELATVVIGGLISSTFLTLVVVPVVYTIVHVTIPNLAQSLGSRIGVAQAPSPTRS